MISSSLGSVSGDAHLAVVVGIDFRRQGHFDLIGEGIECNLFQRRLGVWLHFRFFHRFHEDVLTDFVGHFFQERLAQNGRQRCDKALYRDGNRESGTVSPVSSLSLASLSRRARPGPQWSEAFGDLSVFCCVIFKSVMGFRT